MYYVGDCWQGIETGSSDRDYQLWALLRQTRDAVSRARGKELNEYGVSGRQSSILFTIQLIEQAGSIATPAEIARWQFREPHSVSTLLKRMAREGLVNKVKDLDRKNLIRVSITEKGWQIYELARKRNSIHRLLSCLSGEEHQQLIHCLRKLRHAALKDGGNPELPWP